MISEADWIIEAVTENLEIKRSLLERVATFRKPGSVVSSNTSGLPVGRIAAGLPEEFRRHWLGTHFFNPPRYLHLLEVIPGPDTLPEVLAAVSSFADHRLGKGVVRAKDTPNFIANRIGVFSTCNIFRIMQEEGLTVEEVDRLTGAILGWPKSATFGTIDLVGLDILVAVTRNLFENTPNDECREMFRLPTFVETMLARGLPGSKTGAGFYQRLKKSSGSGEILTLDLETLEYRPPKKVQFPSLDAARNIEDLGQRIRMLLQSDDRAGRFLWKAMSATFLYAARRIPEIADRIVEIDRAMKWGFGWELGSFEMWDAVGVEESLRRMETDGFEAPENVRGMLLAGHKSFYLDSKQGTKYFDFRSCDYQLVEQAPGVLLLHGGSNATRIVRKNADASLIDLGDGVACVEFHSKMNAIGPEIINLVKASLHELSKSFDALVIANQGANFSAGANILLLLMEIRDENWDEVDAMVRSFQEMTLAIKYSAKPVVAAPFKLALGGGAEVVLAAPRVQAGAELYIGLVEAGVGLVPAGGGAKDMLLRAVDPLPPGAELLPAVSEVFQTIAYAKVSTSAEDARKLRFLRPGDGITMNPDRLAADAKQAALEIVREGYRPAYAGPRTDIRVPGEAGLAELKLGIYLARRGEFISEYEAAVAGRIAHVLCGGELTGPAVVSEQYLLDLEREAFLSLCGEAKTQARIQHMLQTGKPLRN